VDDVSSAAFCIWETRTEGSFGGLLFVGKIKKLNSGDKNSHRFGGKDR